VRGFDPSRDHLLPLDERLALWLPRKGKQGDERVTIEMSARTALACVLLLGDRRVSAFEFGAERDYCDRLTALLEFACAHNHASEETR
jgi:hypothetical protein